MRVPQARVGIVDCSQRQPHGGASPVDDSSHDQKRCECFHCGGRPCPHGHCQSCGTLEDSQCAGKGPGQGCYTSHSQQCQCGELLFPGGAESDDDEAGTAAGVYGMRRCVS